MTSRCELPVSLSGRAHWPAGLRRGARPYVPAWRFFAGRAAALRHAAEFDVAMRRLFAARVVVLRPSAVAARRAPLGPGVLPERPEPPALPLPVVPSFVPVRWRSAALARLPSRGLCSGAKILSW
jgi:hypothetical protein